MAQQQVSVLYPTIFFLCLCFVLFLEKSLMFFSSSFNNLLFFQICSTVERKRIRKRGSGT